MKKTILIALTAVLLTMLDQVGRSADVPDTSIQTDLQPVIQRIQEKLKTGKDTATDLADNLKELDALITKYKSTDKEGAAGISLMKAQVYAQVLNDDTHAVEVLNQVTKDYAGTKNAAAAEKYLAQLKTMEAAKQVQRALVTGAQFPEFSEKDLAGKPLAVANFKGKVVLIDFWATWCGPCRAELPNVSAAYQKYHSQGFEIIGVSLDSERPRLESFLKASNMTWPQYFDGLGWGNKLAGKYGITSIPATFLLDRDGKIIAQNLRGEELVEAVAKALAKK